MKLQRLVSRLVLLSFAGGVFVSCAVKSRNFGEPEKPGGKGDASTDGAAGTGGAGGTGASAGGSGTSKGGTSGTSGTANGGGDGGPVCTPKQPACDGNRATTCSDDGTGYAAGGTDCGGQTCDQGTCKCVPRTKFCQSNAVYSCAADGTSSRTEACGKHQYCDASDTKNPTCADQICDPGTFNCAADGLQPVKCSDDGSAYVPDGPVCDGVCVGAGDCQCIPDAHRCAGTDGKQPQVCIGGDAGTSWVNDGLSCDGPADAGCNEGRCIPRTVQIAYGNWSRTLDGTGTTYHTVSANVKLDKYETTVGQFRRFLEAVIAGWTPPNGSGKHTHLYGGNGLLNSGTDTGNELGWDTSWTTDYLWGKDRTLWNTNLTLTGDPAVVSKFATWTPAPGPYENKPMNLITWYEAYAYCIWTGGYLPSEAEWEWAARGQDHAYTYPWGNTPLPGDQGAYAVYNCTYPASALGVCSSTDNIAEVNGGPALAGASVDGLIHMAGNVWEWVLDWDAPYPAECLDCANTHPYGVKRVHRGGDFQFYLADIQTFSHRVYQANYRDAYGGVRCARAPSL